MDHILGARDTNARPFGQRNAQAGSWTGGGAGCTPGAASSASHCGGASLLTQPRSTMQTPVPAASAASMASSRGVTPEWGSAAPSQQQTQTQQEQQQPDEQHQTPASRPASAAVPVDVSDVRRLVSTVEALQRQLAVKNDRIKQLRQALEQATGGGATCFTPAGSRPGSASVAAAPGDALVLRQRLDAATASADNLRALNAALEQRLSEAQQVQQAAQSQLAAATRSLATLLAGGGSGGSGTASRPSSAQGSLPSTNGDAGSVLRLQAAQCEQLVAQAGEQLAHSRAELARAQQDLATATLQLASRGKLVEALQAQLRTVSGVATGTQTEQLLMAQPPAQVHAGGPAAQAPAAAVTADALGSLDRIVSYWKQACSAKDAELERLRGELAQVCFGGRK